MELELGTVVHGFPSVGVAEAELIMGSMPGWTTTCLKNKKL